MGNGRIGGELDCQGKKRLPTPQLAWRILLRPRRDRREYRTVYRCASCGGWHLGGDSLGKHKAGRKTRVVAAIVGDEG